jgi:hypothetical protein
MLFVYVPGLVIPIYDDRTLESTHRTELYLAVLGVDPQRRPSTGQGPLRASVGVVPNSAPSTPI